MAKKKEISKPIKGNVPEKLMGSVYTNAELAYKNAHVLDEVKPGGSKKKVIVPVTFVDAG